MRKPKNRALTREDWTAAALGAIARGGIEAVRVEPLAAKLGATKGSFYWHFENRDALIEAALEEWERSGTEAVIEELERAPTPAERFQRIYAWTTEMPAKQRAVEIALLARPDHPAALRSVRRVARRRIEYTAEQLKQLGWDSNTALDRALLIFYLFVGYLVTTHVRPALLPGQEDARARYANVIFEALAAGGPGMSPPQT
jgi:AcrR family transcriptional regulator